MSLTLLQYQQFDNFYSESDISATVILDSTYFDQNDVRLLTMELVIPQMIHAELIRHRSFSFSISSQRSVRFEKALNDTYFVPRFRTKGKGMQPGGFCSDEEQTFYSSEWLYLRQEAISIAESLNSSGVAKEIVNRLLFPWQTIKVLVTGTETAFNSFIKLRNHPDAKFEIQVLARRVEKAIENSEPTILNQGEWHTPYIRFSETGLPKEIQIATSVARCARTSYKLTGTNMDSKLEKDVELFSKLISEPIHASPLEHVATPVPDYIIYKNALPNNVSSNWYGNFGSTFVQLRKFFELSPETENFSREVVTTTKMVKDMIN